jgi:hypothetical protein
MRLRNVVVALVFLVGLVLLPVAAHGAQCNEPWMLHVQSVPVYPLSGDPVLGGAESGGSSTVTWTSQAVASPATGELKWGAVHFYQSGGYLRGGESSGTQTQNQGYTWSVTCTPNPSSVATRVYVIGRFEEGWKRSRQVVDSGYEGGEGGFVGSGTVTQERMVSSPMAFSVWPSDIAVGLGASGYVGYFPWHGETWAAGATGAGVSLRTNWDTTVTAGPLGGEVEPVADAWTLQSQVAVIRTGPHGSTAFLTFNAQSPLGPPLQVVASVAQTCVVSVGIGGMAAIALTKDYTSCSDRIRFAYMEQGQACYTEDTRVTMMSDEALSAECFGMAARPPWTSDPGPDAVPTSTISPDDAGGLDIPFFKEAQDWLLGRWSKLSGPVAGLGTSLMWPFEWLQRVKDGF